MAWSQGDAGPGGRCRLPPEDPEDSAGSGRTEGEWFEDLAGAGLGKVQADASWLPVRRTTQLPPTTLAIASINGAACGFEASRWIRIWVGVTVFP